VTATPRSANTTAALTPAMPPPTTTASVPGGAADGRAGSAATSRRGRMRSGAARARGFTPRTLRASGQVYPSAGYGAGADTSHRKHSSTRTRSGAGAGRGRRMSANDVMAAATTRPAEISTDMRKPALSATGSE